jgi:chemotaxis protein MotA
MNLIVGLLVVVGCVLGGFAVHGGEIMALWQPSEIVIIGGAAIGAFIIANPFSVSKRAASGIAKLLKGSPYKKVHYQQLFAVMYDLLSVARKEGMMGLERIIEDPAKSEIFVKRPLIGKDQHVTEFIQDYLRLIISGDMDQHQLEALMDLEIDTHHHDAGEPAGALARMSDAMPGFGIVAAVLGIVNTMSALEGSDTATIGHKVGAALVGTFLGILVSYGFIGPIASAMESKAADEGKAFEVVKMALVASVRGYAPSVAVEFARKLLFSEVRPTFADLENELKGRPKAAA